MCDDDEDDHVDDDNNDEDDDSDSGDDNDDDGEYNSGDDSDDDDDDDIDHIVDLFIVNNYIQIKLSTNRKDNNMKYNYIKSQYRMNRSIHSFMDLSVYHLLEHKSSRHTYLS